MFGLKRKWSRLNFIYPIDSMSRNDRMCSGTSSKNCLTQNGPDKMDSGTSDNDRWAQPARAQECGASYLK